MRRFNIRIDAEEYARPLITIVMNNAGYLSMKRGVTSLYPQGWAARTNNFPGWAILPNPRYAELAKAFDACGETIEDPAAIEPALRRAFERNAPVARRSSMFA